MEEVPADIIDGVATSSFRCAIPNPKRYMKRNRWDLTDVANAAYEGDLALLETLLATGDENNLFNGDLNQHFTSKTTLQLAVESGHSECVELLLKAKADPHIREQVNPGQDPEDGKTALDISIERGWDDLVPMLEEAEKQYSYGFYMPAGVTANCKVYDCWEWGTKPARGWYMSRPGAAKREGLDPKRYGVGVEEDKKEEELFTVPAPKVKQVPPLPIALIFPGQGSQYVKMMSKLKDLPKVQEYASIANEIMGFDILKVCLDGPEDQLAETRVCQPAMFLASMAGFEKLRGEREEAVTRCKAVAGLSLGEYSALCAAGVFSFEDALRLVKLRGEAMQDCANSSPQAMLSVAGLDKPKLVELCAEAERSCGGGALCRIANELFMKGFACAGTADAITKLQALAESAGALQAKIIKTSGAFHTELMRPAQQKLAEALQEVLPKMQPPRCAVYMNFTAAPVPAGTAPKEIVELLKKQMVHPVKWDESVKAMIRDGATEFYEVGPMKQLKAMMKRIDQKMWSNTKNVEV